MAAGQVVTWGQSVDRQGRIVTAAESNRRDRAERSVLLGLGAFDLVDVFPVVNGYGMEDSSWFLWRKGRCIARRRFDHLFPPRAWPACSCRYWQEPREAGLSDHAVLVGEWEVGL